MSLTLSGFLYQCMMPLTCSSCVRFLNKALRIFSSYDAKSPPVSRSGFSGIRNEIKAQIIRAGMTMQEVVDLLSDEYGWSDSVSNLSAKLQRESIRYKEVLELAAVLGYDIVWQKRREK